MLFGDGPKGNKFANAGVGENNIDSPLHLRDGLVKTIKVSQLGNVSLNSRNVGADCLHGLVEFLLAAARDEDIGTLFDEKLCRSQSNPFCPAGDDGGLAFELFGHCLLFVIVAGYFEIAATSVAPNWNRILPLRFDFKDWLNASLNWSSGYTCSTAAESAPSATRSPSFW